MGRDQEVLAKLAAFILAQGDAAAERGNRDVLLSRIAELERLLRKHALDHRGLCRDCGAVYPKHHAERCEIYAALGETRTALEAE